MAYLVKFMDWLVKSDGSKTQFLHSKESKKFTSRKDIFAFLETINETQTNRWSYTLKPGEHIECTDIEILEPKIEERTLPNGTIVKRKSGYKTFTKAIYESTYCRICGRLLTDPLSVTRKIGPDCWEKYHL